MDGPHMISTFDVTARVLQLACLKSKMEIALEVTLTFHGHLRLMAWLLLTMMPSFSICLANVTSLPNKQEEMYSLQEMWVLASMVPSKQN